MEKKKILIVDDEKELIEVFTLRLRSSGYEVLSAFDGESGLEKARNEKPDLILLDVVMPKQDGLKVCRQLKHESALASTPVILLTAKDQADPKRILSDTKADAIFMKPFDPQELLAAIKKLIK